jgi:hypothetical protein
MTFPTGTISTTHLDSSADDPSQARADIYNAVVALNTIISEANTANGVALLGGTGKVGVAQLPTTLNVTGDLTLQPSTGVILVRDILYINPQTTADINLFASPAEGMLAYATNGAGGSPCLAVYDGTAWKRIALGATISST